MAERKVVLEGKELTKDFKGLRANENVSFKLFEGEILGLIGPNGAGKTTLVNMLSGTLSITSGDVIYNDRSIKGLKPYQIGRLGLIRTYQIVKPFPGMSVLENISVGAMFGSKDKVYSSKESKEKAEEIADFVGLSDLKNQRADQLNIAAKKRLEIAKALAARPNVVLFDEVMAGLNHKEIDSAVKLIKKIRDTGISIIVIEHVMRAIKAISDKIFVLHHGVKIAEGEPDDVLSDEEVIKAYLGKRYKQLVS